MKLYEFFEDNTNCYMVSEYCDHGDLLQKMQKLNYMNEIVVKFLMEQILNAIAYLHSKGVFHGDIKLENIMLYTTTKSVDQRFTIINKQITFDKKLQNEIDNSFKNDSVASCPSSKSIKIVNEMLNYEIKLIDFGCSKIFTKRGERKSGIIGTSIYCSPEVIDDLYDEKCDEWACGVLMYLLLCGEPPFNGETEEEIFEKVKKCQYDFSPPEFKNVSENCKNLIKKLLEPKISRRIRAQDALKHPFFSESFNPDKVLTRNKDLSIIEKLPTLKVPHSQFHRAILSYMCTNYISKDEEKKLRAVFRYMDYDGKSFLTKSKIEKALKDNGNLITVYKIQNIIEALDFDKNGVIEYQEYIQGLCNKNALFNEFNLKNVFVLLDTDNKGYLTSTDIKNFAFPEKTVNDEAIKEYLKQFGMKIDDKLSFDDFVYIIQNNCSLNLHDFSKKQSQKSLGVENEIDLSLYTNENEGSEISDNETNGQDSKEKVNLRSPICLIKK
jgi:calcium-dependent protein kinase